MPKLLWVALPLLIAATLLALQALLRRRAPSRRALNIWSSLLLTGYVATTAGLGIFWGFSYSIPAITIRATQKKIISCPVTKTEPG